MSAKELPEEADVEHPRLPGQELQVLHMTEGRVLCSPTNQHAYIIGEVVEVGTDEEVEE